VTRPTIRFLPGRHKRVASGHPWIYSNEIVMDDKARAIQPGALVDFLKSDGVPLCRGSFNARTLIAGRVFARDPVTDINTDWLRARLRAARDLRDKMFDEPYYRLVHAEADGLPGLIVDRFKNLFVAQLNTAGMDLLWPMLEEVLVAEFPEAAIVLRNDSGAREHEGLPREVKVARGEVHAPVALLENGATFYADPAAGQKTGWYFDQRENRRLVAQFCRDADVLDVYCHTGGFAVQAARAGARSVIGVDSSASALELAAQSAEANEVMTCCAWHKADAFEDLEKRGLAGEKYDVVIADPPAFVKSKKDIPTGSHAYRKLARMASALVKPGGFMFIASCSHNMDLTSFADQVAKGMFDAGRAGRILHTCFAAADHPVHTMLPETGYLKGHLIQID